MTELYIYGSSGADVNVNGDMSNSSVEMARINVLMWFGSFDLQVSNKLLTLG